MAMLRIASLYNRWGRVEIAREIVDLGVFVAAANGLGSELAHGLVMQSSIELTAGNDAEAERLALAARAQGESSGTELVVAIADNVLGVVAARRGDVSGGLLRFASALAFGHRAGEQILIPMCLNNIGRAYIALGMPEEALPRYEEAVRLGTLYNPLCAVHGYAGLAVMNAENGVVESAEHYAQQAVLTATTLDSPGAVAYAYNAATAAAISAGRLDDAERSLRICELLSRPVVEQDLKMDIAVSSLSFLVAASRPGPALEALERAEAYLAITPDMWARRRVSLRAAELRKLTRDQSGRWLRALSAHVPHEDSHARRVADWAVMLGELVALEDRDRRALEIGATLHDIGAISLPQEFVRRTDVFNSVERQITHAHVEAGEERLALAGYPESVRRIVRHHHERWDGAGYPDQLAGSAIPIGARITAIAERYEALRRGRGLRSGLPEGAALKRLSEEAGVSLDPTLCMKFINAIRTGYERAGHGGEHEPAFTTSSEPLPVRSDEMQAAAAGLLRLELQDLIGDRYRIIRQLDGAGTAAVFVAEDLVLTRQVVIKALHCTRVGPIARVRFRREMALAAGVRHPNVLPVLDAHVAGRVQYFISPFIEGGSLRDRMQREPVDLREAL
jgi:HD-GYP domain-containing protein (c-di-GMP phosphodiesterase class II)